jgi:hypothetical protein
MDAHGNMASVLRAGTNEWLCVPGDENRVGDPPMCSVCNGSKTFMPESRRPPSQLQAFATCSVAPRSIVTTHPSTVAVLLYRSALIGWCFGPSKSSIAGCQRRSEMLERGSCSREQLTRICIFAERLGMGTNTRRGTTRSGQCSTQKLACRDEAATSVRNTFKNVLSDSCRGAGD